ncbi:MAG TPA: DUF2911 domain-containing protein [Flavisolibacter sp.]|nr:DUF2911 domain-containing protein [Flavisolibacter sp.]
MKKLFPFLCLLLITCSLSAQTQVASKTIPPVLDKSPMDMVYYPANYPVLKIQEKVTEPLLARVIYSRPQKNDRTIFGDLIEYNSIWRLGANEATEIELFKDVKINGKKLLKGRYTLYAIPTPTQWTIIFNKDTDIWGAFKYDQKKDVLRVDVPTQKNETITEAFTIDFQKTQKGADLLIAWDDVSIELPITTK